MAKFTAFIDESGNHDLETQKSGVTKFYVLAAVVVETERLPVLQIEAERLRARHYGNGEIKSSKTDEKRRLKVLGELHDIDFKFIATVIDKDAIRKDSGLAYKQSFVKFLNGLLYRSLVRTHQDVEIYADQQGREEFMASFRSYITENHIPDLFSTTTVSHVASHENVLVQLADFLAGTIRKVYEGAHSDALEMEFMRFANKAKLAIDEWPPALIPQTPNQPHVSEHDAVVHAVAMNEASNFIIENDQNPSVDLMPRLLTVRYLLFKAKFDSQDYVSSAEILKHLASRGLELSEHQFKSSVISRLRDQDVLIASSSRGYKIPQTYKDVLDFVELVNGQTLPLLDRLNKAHASLFQASMGTIDLFNQPQLSRLKKVTAVLRDE